MSDRKGSIRESVRECVLESHRETVAAVIDCGDAVVADWGRDWSDDPAQVRSALAAEIRASDLRSAFVTVLRDAVAATGRDLLADPVPASPYVVVTSQGPVCRVTVSDARIVITMAVFRVDRTDGGPRYVRTGTEAEDVLSVEARTVSG